MRKNVLAASVVSGLLAWSSAVAALPSGCWEPSVKARLDEVIAQNQGNSDAYAVFDFDYTTAIGDLSLSCVWEMLETLDFREGDFRSHVRIGLPERFRREAEALADLADKLGVPCGAGMSRTPAWGAFARGYWKLFWSIRDTCGDPALCRWRMGLFAGYEPAEMRRFAVRATTRALAFGGVVADRTVPTVRRGMALPQEIKDLFHALRAAGISVYIVSGSCQEFLRAVTGDAFGLDVPPECVFGVTYRLDEKGRFLPNEGEGGVTAGRKLEFIRAHIAPRHHGADPVLTGGDSMGDYTMLTGFKGLQAALVFPRDQGQQKMDALIASAPMSGGRVIVQGRDEPHGRFVPSCQSVFPPPGRP